MTSIDPDFYKSFRRSDSNLERLESQDFTNSLLREIKRVARNDSHYRMWIDIKIKGRSRKEVGKEFGVSPLYVSSAVYRTNQKLMKSPRIIKYCDGLC